VRRSQQPLKIQILVCPRAALVNQSRLGSQQGLRDECLHRAIGELPGACLVRALRRGHANERRYRQ
jgi:hypothetical protein